MATSNKGPKRVMTFDVLRGKAFEFETKEWKTLNLDGTSDRMHGKSIPSYIASSIDQG